MENLSLANKNTEFWNELCGSHMAKELGIIDSSQTSLKKFDDWYFEFYPYLEKHIPFQEMAGKDVLEIGLGYGSVAQKLVESGAQYTGLDISPGPVFMANHRIRQISMNGEALQASILNPGLPDNSYDYIFAIGCLHHTGNLNGAISQCYRMLKPGGQLIFMVYYSYSYRRWFNAAKLTLHYAFKEFMGYRGPVQVTTDKQRAHYDTNSSGMAAPHTDWISKKSLKNYCREFSECSVVLENIDQERPFLNRSRSELIKTVWPRMFGLDAYVRCVK